MKNVLKKLLKVKSEMGSVSKKADNPFFKSKYADLNSHLGLVEPLLSAQGLILLQPVESDERGDKVVTKIVDVDSGEEVRSEMHLVLVKNDMQQAGSAITYARRYTLGSLLGMMAEDDDGEAATGRGKAAAPKSWAPAPRPVQMNTANTDTQQSAPVEKSVTSFRKKTVKLSTPVNDNVSDENDNGWE